MEREAIRGLITAIQEDGEATRASLEGLNEVNFFIESQLGMQTSFLESMVDLLQDSLDFTRETERDRARREALSPGDREVPPQEGPRGPDVDEIPNADQVEGAAAKVGLFASLFGALGTSVGDLILPLRGIGKLVFRGGAIFAVVGLLYSALHDIGDNPKFVSALKSLSDTWNNKVVPTFNKIVSAIDGLIGDGDGDLGTEISEMWTKIKGFIQDSVIMLVNAIDGTLRYVSAFFETWVQDGPYKAFEKLAIDGGTALLNALGGFAGWFIENLALKFGVNSETAKGVGNFFRNISTHMSTAWNFLRESYEEVGIAGMIRDTIKAAINWVATDLFGFDENSPVLSSFNKLIDIIAAPLYLAVGWIKGLFQFNKELAKGILTGNFDWSSMASALMEPIRAAVSWLYGVFGWEEPTESPVDSIMSIVGNSLRDAAEWVKMTTQDGMTYLKEAGTSLINFISGIPDRALAIVDRLLINLEYDFKIAMMELFNFFTVLPEKLKQLANDVIQNIPILSNLLDEPFGDIQESINESSAQLQAEISKQNEERQRRLAELEKESVAPTSGKGNTNNSLVAPSNVNIDNRQYKNWSTTINQICNSSMDADPASPASGSMRW